MNFQNGWKLDEYSSNEKMNDSRMMGELKTWISWCINEIHG
jgi:hypothetical protein